MRGGEGKRKAVKERRARERDDGKKGEMNKREGERVGDTYQERGKEKHAMEGKRRPATHLCLKLALDKNVEYIGYTLNIH